MLSLLAIGLLTGMVTGDTVTADRMTTAKTTESCAQQPFFLTGLILGERPEEDVAASVKTRDVSLENQAEFKDFSKLSMVTPEESLGYKTQSLSEVILDLPKGVVQAANETESLIEEETEDKQQFEYSEDEKQLIARVVWGEARGESFEGMVAVAQVVLNRFESGKFQESLKRVVFARHQFAVGKRYTETCMDAVEYAIEYMPHPKTMFFFQVSRRKKWRNFEYYDRIGNHNFFCTGE